MRSDLKTGGNKVKIDKIKGLLGVYEARAETDKKAFMEAFKRRGVPLYDVKYSKKSVSFTSPVTNRRKIFAISDNMCYNIRETGYKGKFALAARAAKKSGLIIAFALICAFAAINDNRIGKIEFTGDGSLLKKEAEIVLNAENVRAGEFFPDDMNELSRKITLSSEKFEFVSVSKRGRTLSVEARAAAGKTLPLNERKKQIISPCDGVVRRISRYSGTSLVSVGDTVKKGDLLIDGYFEKNGERYETESLGDVEIAVTEKYDYKTSGEGEKFRDRAKAVAREKYEGKDVISISAELTAPCVYTVTMTYAVIAN